MAVGKTWHVDPGNQIILPQGSERMRTGFGSEVWYNPIMNRSYYITGSARFGWDVIEYNQPLCPKCWERYNQYREGRR